MSIYVLSLNNDIIQIRKIICKVFLMTYAILISIDFNVFISILVHYFIICFRHLRDQHCSREGGSFVCLYGYNGVCTSLPVEGVSDKDYIAHAMKHAIMQQQRKSNGDLSEASSSWTVYSAAQNLPAVLNDPFKGKQSNFLTRTWGDGFVEKIDIPKSPYLPEVTMQHFEMYLKKIARVIIHALQ